MDIEVEATLENLPRERRGALNGRVWIDASGALQVEIDDGGGFTLDEEDLDLLNS